MPPPPLPPPSLAALRPPRDAASSRRLPWRRALPVAEAERPPLLDVLPLLRCALALRRCACECCSACCSWSSSAISSPLKRAAVMFSMPAASSHRMMFEPGTRFGTGLASIIRMMCTAASAT